MNLYRPVLFFLFFLLPLASIAGAVKLSDYGLSGMPNIKDAIRHDLDSLMKRHPMLMQKSHWNIEVQRARENRTADFYLMLFLLLSLGIIRLADPKYFHSLWHAFQNPTLSGRQLKEKIQGSSFSNLAMNIFFTISMGMYLFFIVKYLNPAIGINFISLMFMLFLVAGVMFIYFIKYAIGIFSGWAFKVESIMEQYLFNVFLVNKILGILLLPVTIGLAFMAPAYSNFLVLISGILIIAMLINRYLRSWQVFGAFFQYSKFHFFTYLCASELLPMAVLMKLLAQGLL